MEIIENTNKTQIKNEFKIDLIVWKQDNGVAIVK